LILLKAVGEPLIHAPIVDEGDVVVERLTRPIAAPRSRMTCFEREERPSKTEKRARSRPA
jgi:hypothetical protein